jgi:hypothetical protein
MKYWGGRAPPHWVREIASERPRLLIPAEPPSVVPQAGDIVLKPFIDLGTYRQLFRVETWNTHDLLDGPFDNVRDALAAALEFGAIARLAVWLDYSDAPLSHELDSVPLYVSDLGSASSQSVA